MKRTGADMSKCHYDSNSVRKLQDIFKLRLLSQQKTSIFAIIYYRAVQKIASKGIGVKEGKTQFYLCTELQATIENK